MKTMLQKVNASLKKNNKGFTLVELIIVIAIIAVLAAVIAPQYIKYVEKSKAAADATTMGAVVQAVNTLCADGTITANETFTWNRTAGTISSSLTSGGHATDVTNITGTKNLAAKSKTVKDLAADPTVVVTFTNNVPAVTYTPDTYTNWGN
jgi:type IV pilus assembly protein PilA